MDTVTVPELAERIRVSLPTAHHELDRRGVPRSGRGVPRQVPGAVARDILASARARRGSPRQRLLLALRLSPNGSPSARRLGRRAGVSPTTASKLLSALERERVVIRTTRRTPYGGKVIDRPIWVLDPDRPRSIDDETVGIELPAPPVGDAVEKIPREIWHHFWNSTPSELRMTEHGAYVARRLLNSHDLDAISWAVRNASSEDLRRAVSGRGVSDPRVRAFVENWLARR